MSEGPKKMYLWVMPRSLSTTMLRAFMSRTDTHCFVEPWAYSFYMSSDRISDRYSREDEPDRPGASFADTKARLEGDFSGHKIVFIKDMCYRLKTFFEADTVETILPRGYMHTFLIRHPAKTIVSWYNGTSKGDSGLVGFKGGEEMSYLQPLMMLEYVQKRLGQKAIVIDADDLQADPETTVKLYCDAVGIDFQECMLKWNPLTPAQYKQFEEWAPWLETALNSSGFLKKTPSKLPKVEELPQDVQDCIKENVPHYMKMYEQRLKP